LSQNNKINRIYVKSNANKEEYFIADDTVIELIHSKLSLIRLTEAWIKLLFISSLKRNIKKTKVIFRTENNYKSQIIQSPGVKDSNLILEEYINILKNLKNIFKVSETMYSFVPIYPSGIWSWTFASSEDLNLSKQNYDEALKIEKGCEIWNLNFQNAAFKMMPNKIVKELNS